ncbi:uncharacterized protein LOC111290275 [Durio zibethinus]|uniref:Uncharacterized protein LOC111290275 n=1 Tax=Durio zibethinus TaxID=66656 RepID=A0A6P5YBB1_DURZI|nr:uncharacterized protein LOC111290275 [Durio zibethinus]
MTLLDVITKALPNVEPLCSQADHPIMLNPDRIFLNLKPEVENSYPTSLKVGFLMGRDVLSLVSEACIILEIWELLEALIVNGLVDHSCYPNLAVNVAANLRADLLFVLNMLAIWEELESQALLSVEKARLGKKLRWAKEASILLMVAHDGFSDAELCLHYLLASNNVDEVILSSSIGKLGGKETVNLIRHLGKWLTKYENFLQPFHEGFLCFGVEGL